MSTRTNSPFRNQNASPCMANQRFLEDQYHSSRSKISKAQQLANWRLSQLSQYQFYLLRYGCCSQPYSSIETHRQTDPPPPSFNFPYAKTVHHATRRQRLMDNRTNSNSWTAPALAAPGPAGRAWHRKLGLVARLAAWTARSSVLIPELGETRPARKRSTRGWGWTLDASAALGTTPPANTHTPNPPGEKTRVVAQLCDLPFFCFKAIQLTISSERHAHPMQRLEHTKLVDSRHVGCR